ncbi:MAG: NAD(P)/FAD-dependent oxidoreductase [Henriciella sp.]
MDRLEADFIVIGAGVIGLSIARAAALSGREVIVLEAESLIASHTSSRNSEVIHAGLYYVEGSLKATHSVAGRRALYAYLEAHGIPHRKCGKLVVARQDETDHLEGLLARAVANGVENLQLLTGDQARALESALHPDLAAAIHSGETGIFDSHAYFLALQGEMEDHGGTIAFETPVLGGAVDSTGMVLETGGEMPALIKARTVINAAGHHAVRVARSIEGPHVQTLPKPRFVKGSYFSISGQTPFSRLIYPMPGRASLGLHLTVDLGGRGKLGPDAEWLPEGAAPPFDYRVDPARSDLFYSSARQYWPGLPDGALSPDYAGVRPKLVGPGDPSGDFCIECVEGRLVNLMGMESPGLTSSLSVAQYVMSLLE